MNENDWKRDDSRPLSAGAVTLIANQKCWMEQNALDQLNALAKLEGVRRVVGLPDLHAGRTPVGAVVETEGILYPHLLGNDIGCGMGLFRTGIDLRRYRQSRFVSRLNHIRELADLGTENPYPEESPIYDLGTIGRGNHFAEFQAVERILEPETAAKLGLKTGELLLLVHSGSRGYGQRIAGEFCEKGGGGAGKKPAGSAGLPLGSEKAVAYLALHDDALLWARRNRLLVARKLVGYLGFSGPVFPILDCPHNFLELCRGADGASAKTASGTEAVRILHRKGAVSAENQAVVIPGSRGSLTYLAAPTGEAERLEFCLHSLSHGEGRKWPRSLCKSRIREKYDRDSIRCTVLKSRVVCHDTELLYQEAPEAYKNVEQVIDSLAEQRLIRVAAELRPLITFKG